MELAATRGSSSSGGLSLAAISAVFTIAYVCSARTKTGSSTLRATCSLRMAAFGSMAALTRDGIEYLQQIIADERAAGRALPQVKLTE